MAVSFDRVASRYDETRGGLKRGREMGLDARPWLAPGTVLEVCVGTGVVASALAETGLAVLGIDISREMTSQALVRLGPRVALGDACALPVRSASVDNVLFVMALHVVGDVPATLAEAARVLRPGGRVVAIHDAPEPKHTDLIDAMRSLDGMRKLRVDDVGRCGGGRRRGRFAPGARGMDELVPPEPDSKRGRRLHRAARVVLSVAARRGRLGGRGGAGRRGLARPARAGSVPPNGPASPAQCLRGRRRREGLMNPA